MCSSTRKPNPDGIVGAQLLDLRSGVVWLHLGSLSMRLEVLRRLTLGVEQGELNGILDSLLSEAATRTAFSINTVEDLIRYVHGQTARQRKS